MSFNGTTTADLLYGTRAIATHLGIPVRAAEHLIETRRIPFFKIGRTVCARRSRLEEHISLLENNTVA
jgi:excisionase family DNA binding protein